MCCNRTFLSMLTLYKIGKKKLQTHTKIPVGMAQLSYKGTGLVVVTGVNAI